MSSSLLGGIPIFWISAAKFFVPSALVTHIWPLVAKASVAFFGLVSTLSTCSNVLQAFSTSTGSENLSPHLRQYQRWTLSPNMEYRRPSRQSLLDPHCGHRGLMPADATTTPDFPFLGLASPNMSPSICCSM